MPQKDPHQLREEAASAVARGKLDVALALYSELETLEPTAAAWPKRVGETHRRLGDVGAAVIAFERAVDKYVKDGLLVQAIAVCKLILQLDPAHESTARRLSELASPSPAEARAVRAAPRTPSPVGQAPMTTPAVEMARRTVADDKPVRRTAGSRDNLAAQAAAAQAAAARPATAEPPPAVSRTTTAGRGTTISRAALLEKAPPIAATAERRAAREAKREAMKRAATLPVGGGLDAIPLAAAMPDSQRVVRADGTDAGMAVLRCEVRFDDVDDDVEIEVIDPARVALLRTPIFAKLPPESLEKLIGRLDLRLLTANEAVFTEGEAGTTLFVIAEGDVTVESHGNQLATLGPGTFFGEIALVTDLPRSATVRAAGRVELLAIDREVVREAAAEQPEIIGVLLGFVRDRLVDRITRTSALFQPFTEDERAELAARFELVEVDAGAQLISQGSRADGLYIVLAGRVDVVRTGETAAIATLGSGDVFGEMSLMSAKGSTANVRAVTRVLALRLPATIFQEVIMTYPQVLAYLGELSSSRSRLQQAEDILDLHIDLI